MVLTACQKEAKTPVKMEQSSQQEKKVGSSVKENDEIIVVSEILEDGYRQLAGDESFYVKGTIPKHAKFLDSCLPDKTYKFDKRHIKYQLEKGYVILVDNKYCYFTSEKGEAGNIISLAKAKKLTKDVKKNNKGKKVAKEVAGVDVPTGDGFLFTDEKQIIGRTDEGLILDHDGHSHFIFFSDLKGSKWEYLIPNADKLTTNSASSSHGDIDIASHSHLALDDGYVFNPKDIVAEDANGYTVRHGDHFHYIWKSSLGFANSSNPNVSRFPDTRVEQVVNAPKGSNSSSPASEKGFPGIDFPTSDGFLFDGNHVVGHTSQGILVGHGSHTHLIPYEHLRGSSWSHLIPNKNEAIVIPSQPNSEDQETSKKKSYLAKALNLSEESITIIDTEEGPAFLYPHGDHKHAILISKVEIDKPIEDPHADPHVHDKVGMATLKKMGFDDEIILDILHATADTDFPSNETDPGRMKEWLKTVRYLNIGQRSNPLKRKGLTLMPNLEVLGVGFTEIDDISPVLQFQNLKHLWVTKTGIKDYSFIKKLPKLEGIDISQNDISDLSFLKDYHYLKSVSAAGNGISNIEILAQLPHLESLNLDYNNISDISPLNKLSHLQAISLENNQLKDLSALKNKDKLARLFLSNNPNLNIDSLESSSLTDLTVNSSNISNLSFLKNNPALVTLSMSDNKIENLEGVEEAKELVNLNLSKNQISSLEISGKQESIRHLNVSGNQLENLEGVNNYQALENLNASDNQLETLKLEEPNQSITYLDVSKNQIAKNELAPNKVGIPIAIAENFTSAEGGSIENNVVKDSETIKEGN